MGRVGKVVYIYRCVCVCMWTHIHICLHIHIPIFSERVKPPWNQHLANETCPALTNMGVAWKEKGKHKLCYWHEVRFMQERCSDKAPVPHLSKFCKCLDDVRVMWFSSRDSHTSNPSLTVYVLNETLDGRLCILL